MPRRDVVILHLAGELDLATAPDLQDRLRHAVHFGSEVVVNLELVEFMDCAGLRALLEAASISGASVSVTPGPPAVRKLFSLTGAGRTLRVVPGPLRVAA